MERTVPAILLAICALLCHPQCFAQQNTDLSHCSNLYENHNQIDYGPLKLSEVAGSGIVQVKNETEQKVPNSCFVLFTDTDHKLVASVRTDITGHFNLGLVAPGRYRLVARADGFCTANIPLDVVKAKGSRNRKELIVHFRPGGIDDCSYGELVSKKSD